MNQTNTKLKAFSLVEMIVVVAVIGIIAAVAIPSISGLRQRSTSAKNLANAKSVERMSATLASLGVAHVIPDSMGGVEATARLLREGVIVPEGPMEGEIYMLKGLRDNDITELAKYLQVRYDMRELRLVMRDTPLSLYLRPGALNRLSVIAWRSPMRIEKTSLA